MKRILLALLGLAAAAVSAYAVSRGYHADVKQVADFWWRAHRP